MELAGPGPSASPCRVAFSRGVERNVYFALHDGKDAGQQMQHFCYQPMRPAPCSFNSNPSAVLPSQYCCRGSASIQTDVMRRKTFDSLP